MKNRSLHLLLFLQFIVYNGYSQQSQILHLNIHKQESINKITVHKTNSPYDYDDSFVSWGNIDTQSDSNIKLYNFDKSDDFEIVFQLDNVVSNVLIISVSPDCDNEDCSLPANLNTTTLYNFSFENGSYTVNMGPENFIGMTYDEDAIFKFYKCKTFIGLYHDENLIVSRPIDAAITKYMTNLQTEVSINTEMFYSTRKYASNECQPLYDTKKYFVLKSNVPKNIATFSVESLNFTYIEKYNTDLSALSDYKIYNNKREVVHQGTLENKYGVNYLSIPLEDIQSGLTSSDEPYLLEVENINKGKTYFLKFKKI